jgi:hypothetical protein
MGLSRKCLLVFNIILFVYALAFADEAPVIEEEENVIVLTKVPKKIKKIKLQLNL